MKNANQVGNDHRTEKKQPQPQPSQDHSAAKPGEASAPVPTEPQPSALGVAQELGRIILSIKRTRAALAAMPKESAEQIRAKADPIMRGALHSTDKGLSKFFGKHLMTLVDRALEQPEQDQEKFLDAAIKANPAK